MIKIIGKFKYELLIIIIAIIVSVPLCWKTYNYYYDDGIQHIARGFLTMESMNKNQSFTVLSRLENGFGYSWDLFYGPLSSFLMAILGNIFNNILIGYKLLLSFSLFFSGISMYCLVKKITDDKNVGVLASILYMTMPYHLTDMYIRGSIGEFISFVFIPLVFLGLYNLFNENEKDWLLVLGIVGLIITHNLMTIICILISSVYILINLPKFKQKNIRNKFFSNIFFILCISSFFWIPFLETSIYTKYEVYEPGKMATIDSVQQNGLNIKQLFITNRKEYVYELGPHILVMLCFTIAVFRRMTSNIKREYIIFLIIGFLSVFMSTKYFPWKLFGNSFSFIQFPWRMLEISSFCFSIVCAINMGIIIKNFRFLDVVIISIITIIYIFGLKEFIPTIKFENTNPKDLDYEFVSGKNTDCLVGMGRNEYIPKKAYDNYFYIANREKELIILDGLAEISELKKDGNILTAKIEILDDKTYIELPYLYYPGYTVTIDGKKINTYESDNGFLSIGLGKLVKSDLKVEYTGTTIMKFSKLFSIISLIVFCIEIIIPKIKKK